MRPVLDDPAAIEHQDPVHRPHGRKPVRDHDCRPPLDQPLHRHLDRRLALGIQAARRLVQNQDRRRCQESPRDRHALPLAAGKLHATLAHQRRVTLGLADDEIMRIREPRGALDLLGARLRPPISDVFRQRAVKQRRLLRHHGDVPAQAFLRHRGHVLAIDADAAALHIVQPLDQPHRGRFSRAGWAHQPHPFARPDHHRQILEQRSAPCAP